jgi:hypothetical protein
LCFDYYTEPEPLEAASMAVKTVAFAEPTIDSLEGAMDADSTDGYCDTAVESLNDVSNSAACGSNSADTNIGYRYTIDFPVNAE